MTSKLNVERGKLLWVEIRGIWHVIVRFALSGRTEDTRGALQPKRRSNYHASSALARDSFSVAPGSFALQSLARGCSGEQ